MYVISIGYDLNSLKPALWDAANILRGSAVDRTDLKGYILPLLFFKRISDCWDEETFKAIVGIRWINVIAPPFVLVWKLPFDQMIKKHFTDDSDNYGP